MARFKGNVHSGSDRAAATLLYLVLIVAVLLAAWFVVDRAGFIAFWTGVGNMINLKK